MPTVLHLLAPAAVGGMESVVHLLARGLVAAGTPVHAHIVTEPDVVPPLVAGLREGGVTVHVTEVPGRNYGLERDRTRALCREVGAQVVHSHGYRTDVIDTPVVRQLGLPVVSTVHGFTGGGWKNAVYEWLQLRALRRMDRVLAVSRPLIEFLTGGGVAPETIQFVPNAFAPDRPQLSRDEAREALGLSDADGPLIGWIGRLSAEKGPDLLVDAAIAAPRETGRWVMIGAGPEKLALRVQIVQREAPVTMLGLVQDAGRLVRAFDTIVLSSRTEGTPIVALEAMAAGVPVVATGVGGVPDLLADDAGLLVEPGSPERLAAAVTQLLADPARAAALGERGRLRVEERYAPAPWVEQHQRIYAEVARGR